MELYIKLDKDSFGIVSDFLIDDLPFLLFLKKYNIKLKNRPVNWENFNWNEISNEDNLSNEFIYEFQNFLDWNILTRKKSHNVDFIRTFPNLIEWEEISSKMRFTTVFDYDFFEEFKERLNWTRISNWGNMDELFIDKFKDKLDWDVLSSRQGLTRYLVEKYQNRINWERIQTNRSINRDLVEEFRPIPQNEDIEIIEEDNDIIINIDENIQNGEEYDTDEDIEMNDMGEVD